MKNSISCNKIFYEDLPYCNLKPFKDSEDKIWHFYILTNQLHEQYVNIWICTCSIEELLKRKNADMLLPYENFISIKTKKI